MQTICGGLLLVVLLDLVPEGDEFNPICGELPGECRHLFSKVGIERGDLVEAIFIGIETWIFRGDGERGRGRSFQSLVKLLLLTIVVARKRMSCYLAKIILLLALSYFSIFVRTYVVRVTHIQT